MSTRGWVGFAFAVAAGGGLVVGRARADAPAGRFTDNGDGTVTDHQTTLVWQQTAPPSPVFWSQAQQDCASNTAGLSGSGWRLPTIKELQTIVDRSKISPAIDDSFFFATDNDAFWSATCKAGGPVCPAGGSSAWGVYFGSGNVYDNDVSNNNRVRCVR